MTVLPPSTASAGLQVFISYARRDGRRFADWLEGALKQRGFDAYLDRKDIVPGEPWRTRLAELIRASDAVVFVVTPAAVASDVCRWEAEQATEHGKRSSGSTAVQMLRLHRAVTTSLRPTIAWYRRAQMM